MVDFKQDPYDIVIIGAGPHGLVAAKTYLQLSPNVSLLILDSNATVGGVWAKENLYPGLRTNNQLGTFEYTDFDLQDACPGKVHKGEHIPGDVAHDYFNEYSKHFDLLPRIRFGCTVTTAEHLPRDSGGWNLTVVQPSREDPLQIPKAEGIVYSATLNSNTATTTTKTTLTTKKLIIATGLTSRPLPISIPNSPTSPFPSDKLMTFSSFRRRAPHILQDPSITHIAITGGSKAAYDAVYAFASSRKRISWIITRSGYGPAYMAPSHLSFGPVKMWMEPLVTSRVVSWLSPCIWGDSDGFAGMRRLLHGTKWGRWIIRKVWRKMEGDVVRQTGLRSKGPEVEKLIPEENMFWYGAGVSILNYPTDIHRFLQDGTVKVVRADIERLEARSVVLKGGDEDRVEEVDTVICSTGWSWDCGIDFLPKTEHAHLGVPSTDYTPAQTRLWNDLDARADREIHSRFPMLAEGPHHSKNSSTTRTTRKIPEDSKDDNNNNNKNNATPEPEPKTHQKEERSTPWRLYRGIAPPQNNAQRDIVFLGMMTSFQTLLRAEISALWAYAYLNDQLSPEHLETLSNNTSPSPSLAGSEARTNPLPSEEKDTEDSGWLYDASLLSRFGYWRYPMGYGSRYPDVMFDVLPYFDLLLKDLGLRRWRKGWGWFGEVVWGAAGYLRGDYIGVVEEWKWSREGSR